jgi:hypothetical protein
MARTAQQARRDLINVQRLIARLEGRAMINDRDYYATMAVLSVCKYSRHLHGQ